MKWVTRCRARVNRIATAWLIRRFIDPEAELIFVPPEEVAGVQREQGAKGFDAPEATYPHKDERGRCSFEALAEEHRPQDAALRAMAPSMRRLTPPIERRKRARTTARRAAVAPHQGLEGSRSKAGAVPPL